MHSFFEPARRSLFAACFTIMCLNFTGFSYCQDKSLDDEKTSQELFAEARRLIGSQQHKEAAEILAKVVKLDPENATAWQLHGFALHVSGNLDDAIKSHKKASTFESTKGIALYNLGCAYSLKKDLKKSLSYLNQSVDAGFKDVAQIRGDSDLTNVRKLDGFDEYFEVVKNDGKRPTKNEKKFDAKSLVGQWKVTSGKRAGAAIDAERLPQMITITKKNLTIESGDDNPFVFSYKVDVKSSPIGIDFNIEGGPVPEGKAIGILKMDKGKFTLCYDPTGEDRPEKFDSSEANGRFLFVMEKVKK